MIFCTVATHSERYFPSLLASCERHNCRLVVLGWQQKWQGFSWRYNLVKDYLQSLDKNEIVCFIDAFDVIILQDANKIAEAFRRLNVPLVFSVEKEYQNRFHRLAYRKMFPYKCQGFNVCAG